MILWNQGCITSYENSQLLQRPLCMVSHPDDIGGGWKKVIIDDAHRAFEQFKE